MSAVDLLFILSHWRTYIFGNLKLETLQPQTIGQYQTRSKGIAVLARTLKSKWRRTKWLGGVLENGPYSDHVSTSDRF